MALLCYLARKGEVRRDEVVDLLWRGTEDAKARNAFRQALHRLRTALGDEILPIDRENVRLVPSSRLAVDTADFERAILAGNLAEAIALYGGDFLDGFDLGEPAFDQWADNERTRLRARYGQLLSDAAGDAANQGRWEDAITYSGRLVDVAPFDADAARLAATVLISAGRKSEAVDTIQRHLARVESELGMPAQGELKSMLARLTREGASTSIDTRSSGAPSPASLIPFFGREGELAQLLTLWRTTTDDCGSLVLLEGGAGIGKTRLIRELGGHARSLGPSLIVSGAERAASAQLPYGVFAEALKPLVRAPGVAGASAHLLAEAARLLPEMRDAFQLPPVNNVEDETSRLRFFEGIAALVDAAAYEQRTMIVLENLQHAPPSTLDLLSYLVSRLAGAPVMFVLTLRPQETSAGVLARVRALAGGGRDPGPHGDRARVLTLAPLDRVAAVAALASLRTSLSWSDDTLDRVVRSAEGNPLRLIEVMRRVVAGEPPPSAPIPLREVVSERIDRLASSQRRLLLVLALLGRPVPLRLLGGAAHLSETAAADGVAALVGLGFVELDEGSVRVVHEVAAEIVLHAAGPPTRAFMAGWIADALAHEQATASADLARLYAMSGRVSDAFTHTRRAAFDALATGAVLEAQNFFRVARTLAPSIVEQAEIERILDMLGSGKPRLGHGTVAPETPESPPAATSSIPDRDPAVAPVSWWQRAFPNWRMLIAAILVTVVVATVVARARSNRLFVATPNSLDTLIVAESPMSGRRTLRYAIGSSVTGFRIGDRLNRPSATPAWVDSVGRPWSHALPAPGGARVAMARSSDRGTELFVITADRRDTIPIVRAGTGDAIPLGWSPDGAWLLVNRSRTLQDGTFDTDLYAFRVDGTPTPRAIDTTARRSVTEAEWSPDGTRIAWVARAGEEQQLEVFSSLADGSDVRNISHHPADDYHISWGPRGDLLAFTSMRAGNSELYAVELSDNHLWRLTTSAAFDDRARISPDGRSIAFESTRGGYAGVYVMPTLGGEPRPVGDASTLDLIRWNAPTARFVARVQVVAPEIVDIRAPDAATVAVHAFDAAGDSIPLVNVEWRVVDTDVARLEPSDRDSTAPVRNVVGMRRGIARIVASVGRWRSDTAFVRIGRDSVLLLTSGAAPWREHWRAVGEPLTNVSAASPLVLRSSRDFESGVLSRTPVPLLPGLEVAARFEVPLERPASAATSVSLSLVAPEEDASIDSLAPQFLRLASMAWNAESRRMVYSVGREVFTEPVAALSLTDALPAAIRIAADSSVEFVVAGQIRWHSTLRILTAGSRAIPRAHIWISGRATGDHIRVRDVVAHLSARPASTPR